MTMLLQFIVASQLLVLALYFLLSVSTVYEGIGFGDQTVMTLVLMFTYGSSMSMLHLVPL